MGPDALAQVLCHLPKFHDPNLLVGFDSSDDAAVYRLDENTALIQTLDLFPPVVDDPYQYGQIAAANSLSDVYAMGGAPKLALNILCIPEDLPKELVQGILEGGYDKVMEAGAIIAGGHTMKDPEPKYGLSVTGFVRPDAILPNNNAKPGDLLILTKPLGTGILTTALKAGLLSTQTERAVIESMITLNKRAYELMSRYRVNSCTDVTGFGLLGHAFEMAEGSKVSISLESNAIPILPDTRDLAKIGIIPAGAYSNRNYLLGEVATDATIPLDLLDALYDPQTSGGLLISLPKKEAKRLLLDLKGEMEGAEIIGQVLPQEAFPLVLR